MLLFMFMCRMCVYAGGYVYGCYYVYAYVYVYV